MTIMKLIAWDFFRFVLVGIVNTILTYGLFVVTQRLVHYMVAYTVAFAFGIALSYVLNVLFVFTGRHSIKAIFKFPGVYVAQYLYGSITLPLLIEYAGIANEAAMLIVIATSVILTFGLMRLVFSTSAAGDKLTDRAKNF